jgi:hypothetical protein
VNAEEERPEGGRERKAEEVIGRKKERREHNGECAVDDVRPAGDHAAAVAVAASDGDSRTGVRRTEKNRRRRRCERSGARVKIVRAGVKRWVREDERGAREKVKDVNPSPLPHEDDDGGRTSVSTVVALEPPAATRYVSM